MILINMPERTGPNKTFRLSELCFYKNTLKARYGIQLKIITKNGEYELCEMD